VNLPAFALLALARQTIVCTRRPPEVVKSKHGDILDSEEDMTRRNKTNHLFCNLNLTALIFSAIKTSLDGEQVLRHGCNIELISQISMMQSAY
jgi:hypothetical protein